MSRIWPHSDDVIHILDSDDEQAVTQPVQPQTRPFMAGNKRPNIPWQAPVAPSRIVAAVPSPVKPAIHKGLESVSSDWAPAPAASSNQRTAIARKPLMKSVDPVNLTLSSGGDETATVLPSPSARSTKSVPRPQPRFTQPGTPSPPSATAQLPTQKDPPQGTPTRKRMSSPAASPGLGVILAPGPKKRKRRIGGYQPGLLGFDDNQRNSTSDPADPNPDLPTRKRPRLSIDGARRLPAPAENVCIRGLASLKKAVYNDIGTGAPKTGPKVSKKENEAKELRNKSQNKVAAPAKLRRSYLPPCEGPEEVDAVITPTDINNILRTETSGNEAGETCLDIEVDMSGDPPPRGCSPTPVQHLQTPRTPPPAREESHKPSQRTESTQEVINVFDFELNLLCDEENDVDHQLALQLDCEMNSSPTHPTVCAPSVIEPDDAVDFNPSPSRVYPSNLPYGGVPGVGGSWECHDLAPFATEAVTFTGEYLHGPSIKMSDICDTKLAGVSRPHEKGNNEESIERDLEPSPWSSPDGAGVVPESPEVERQSTPEERFITQAAVTSSTGISGSGSSQLNTTPEAFATVDSDMKASDEGVGANHRPSLLATRPEPQEPILPQIPTSRGIHISIIGSECAHQEATAPSKCTVPTSRTTQLQSSSKFTRTAIEGLESLMLKRLNLTPKALAPPNPPVWEVLAPLRSKKLYLSADELAQ